MQRRQTTSSDRITSAEAAALIGITEHSLRTWRYEKRGPRVHTLTKRQRRAGKGSRPRVFYLRSEVEAWKQANDGGGDGKRKG